MLSLVDAAPFKMDYMAVHLQWQSALKTGKLTKQASTTVAPPQKWTTTFS